MATTVAGSGTQTATIGVEHTLLDIATAGVYTMSTNKINMANGDNLELRVYKIVIAGGTRQVALYGPYTDAQSVNDIVALSVPIGNALTDAGSLRFTLTQTAGTGRNYEWEVLKYA